MVERETQSSERFPIPGGALTVRMVPAELLSDRQAGELLDLLGRAFNGGPSWFFTGSSPKGHLDWKGAAYPGRVEFELVEDGGRVVGMRLQPWRRFLLGGREVLVGDGMDSAIDPDYQGQRLDSLRRDVAHQHGLRDAYMAIGYGTHPLSLTRLGRTETFAALGASIETVMKPLSVRAVLRSLRPPTEPEVSRSRTRKVLERERGPWTRARSRSGMLLLGMRLAWSLRPRWNPPSRESWSIRTIEQFDSRIDAFCAAASAPFGLIQVRDRDYLNWRYNDLRGGKFLVRVAESGAEILGYAVVALRERDAILSDLLCAPERIDVARSLLRDASAQSRDAGCATLRAWTFPNHPDRAAFRREGFAPYPAVLHFNVEPGLCDPAELEFLSRPEALLHVMAGDSDHV